MVTYKKYLAVYPRGGRRSFAIEAIDNLLWKHAKKESTKQSYKQYISTSPADRDNKIEQLETHLRRKIGANGSVSEYDIYETLVPYHARGKNVEKQLSTVAKFKRAEHTNDVAEYCKLARRFSKSSFQVELF
ncbi:MAG: hypothetical protein ACR2O1_11140 [Boseongicola sp.]